MPIMVVASLLAKPVDMSVPAELSKLIETFKFWDIVAQWSRERLEHESIVARARAHAVVRDGLPLRSVDPRPIQNEGTNMEFAANRPTFAPNASKEKNPRLPTSK
jgi:hypothetical protein